MSRVHKEVVRNIAWVRLDHPANGNALSDGMVRELTEALSEADRRDDVGAIILSGSGENFCAGGDLNDFLAAKDQPLEKGYQNISPGMRLFALGFQLRTPLVASVHGAARGGGVGLVALAHVVVADPAATFALPEVSLGLFPFGIFPLLSRAMGPRRSLELALLSRTFTAEEARSYGLVHQVSKHYLGDAEKLAQMLASRPSLAVTTGLEAYNHLTDQGSWPLDYLGLLRLLTLKSADLGRNVEKFLNRRPGEGSTTDNDT